MHVPAPRREKKPFAGTHDSMNMALACRIYPGLTYASFLSSSETNGNDSTAAEDSPY